MDKETAASNKDKQLRAKALRGDSAARVMAEPAYQDLIESIRRTAEAELKTVDLTKPQDVIVAVLGWRTALLTGTAFEKMLESGQKANAEMTDRYEAGKTEGR